MEYMQKEISKMKEYIDFLDSYGWMKFSSKEIYQGKYYTPVGFLFSHINDYVTQQSDGQFCVSNIAVTEGALAFYNFATIQLQLLEADLYSKGISNDQNNFYAECRYDILNTFHIYFRDCIISYRDEHQNEILCSIRNSSIHYMDFTDYSYLLSNAFWKAGIRTLNLVMKYNGYNDFWDNIPTMAQIEMYLNKFLIKHSDDYIVNVSKLSNRYD